MNDQISCKTTTTTNIVPIQTPFENTVLKNNDTTTQ